MGDSTDNPFATPEVDDVATRDKSYARPERDVAEGGDDDPINAADMVEVARVIGVGEAEMLRSSIRGAGIRAYLKDDQMGAMLSVLVSVKVMVPKEDVEQAREIIARHKSNEGHPVFMVVRSPAAAYALLGGFVGGMIGMVVSFASQLATFPLAAGAVVGIAIGLWRARGSKPTCSAPSCGRELKGTETICPGCGGTISGTIGHPNERLEAEERLRDPTSAE